MIIDLLGLLEDGSPPTVGVPPENPRTTIRITRGQDVTIRLSVRNTSGSDVPLATGVVVMTVKKRPQDSKVFDKTATVNTITILPADTKNMDPGKWVFDIWLTKDGKRNPVIPLSTLILEATSTPVP